MRWLNQRAAATIGGMSPMFLLLISFLTPAASIDATSSIRPLDRAAERLAADARRLSPTAARLAEAVDRSHVVVYLRTGVRLPARGVLNFAACGGGVTYVQIRIDLNQPPDEKIAVLAHELTHAVELTESPVPVCSEPALAALYRRIGTAGAHSGDLESGRAVASERQSRADQRLALALPCAVTRKEVPPCRR